MPFGIYIHIPYCLDRCLYCDFATYKSETILPPKDYVQLLKTELSQRRTIFPYTETQSIYFGGGTPSQIDPQLIVSVLREIENLGFTFSNNCERTIEINPGTLSEEKLNIYIDAGINRFSLGVQSFSTKFLKKIGRCHSSMQTFEAINLFEKYKCKYSLDLMFALPDQSIDDLKADLLEIEKIKPKHLSAYCLTLTGKHPLFSLQPNDEIQTEMFFLVESELEKIDLLRYEISNFASPGSESKHNLLYWSDQPYWGLGLSAHSYLNKPDWGMRFWNPSNIDDYKNKILTNLPFESETLKMNESLTDFCMTSLRTVNGLNLEILSKKFPPEVVKNIVARCKLLESDQHLEKTPSGWKLSKEGIVLSNQVFRNLVF